MKKFFSLLGSKKGKSSLQLSKKDIIDQDKRNALITSGRKQFKKLQELGLQIPIAVL